MDGENNEDCHIMKNTKFGHCALFEPSAIANCAPVKLDGWSWVCRICQKYIKRKCALEFEYPCFAHHVQFNSSTHNARMNTGKCTHLCRGWASEAAKEQSRAEDQFLRDFFNASGRLLWPSQPTQRPNPSINVQIQNTNTDMVLL